MRKKKQIFGIVTAALIMTTMFTSTVGLSVKAATDSSETSSTAENLTEGNWVYSISASESSGGMGGDAPGGGGSGTDIGTPPDGTNMPDGNATSGDSASGEASDSSTSADNNTLSAPTDMQSPSDTQSTDGMTFPGGTGSSESTATILWGTGAEKSGNIVMIPAEIGGYQVTVLGNGAQNISSNNKNSNTFVLIPEGVTTLSNRMIYDYNSTIGWSIPSTVTSIVDGAFLSCSGIFYGESDSAAETYAASDSTRTFTTYEDDKSTTFTATVGENGYMQPNGTYYLPSAMLDGEHSITFTIVADYQYKIAELIIDGTVIAEASGQSSFDYDYTFTTESSSVSVTFEEDSSDTRDPDEISGTYVYDAPKIDSAAVTDAIDLTDESLYEYEGVNTGSTAKYYNSMGISTGEYYSADGKLYEMVYSSQSKDTPEYYSKAEVINGLYETEGYVYGKDYDLIRLYNYYENVSSGPSQGEVALYCTYLYKEIEESEVTGNTIENGSTNTASIFAQAGSDLTISDFTTYCYTSSSGPSEAGNFYGLGSSILIDGGDSVSAATKFINTTTAILKLINPQILGTVNSIYAAANGVGYIEGGNIFSCTSGGHGPYVSCGGQLLLNTDNTNLVTEDGSINIDISSLTATSRPSNNLGTMARIDDDMEGVFEEHSDDTTVIITGDESGTALATDTGGGVIVANQVLTKTYGLRCAGVYSIGSNESWVYCFNSNLNSYLDAALTSATGGYIFAYNCDMTGVMGIKTRAGGDASSDETGVYVYNSRVSAYYDTAEMESVYDVATPDAWDDSILDEISNRGATSISQLNIFLDKANSPSFLEDSLDWWFTDKSKTPGYSGGNKFAVIYVENSSTPIYVDSSQLINKNYAEYGDVSQLEDGQTPADNLLLSVEGAGSASIYFTNENSSTSWDLTEEESGSCELIGDFYLGAYSESGGDANIGTGANSLQATFTNSEWTGTILYGDDEMTGSADLTFDADSTWTVTSDTTLNTLELTAMDQVISDSAVTITYASSNSVTEGTYGNVTYVKSVSSDNTATDDSAFDSSAGTDSATDASTDTLTNASSSSDTSSSFPVAAVIIVVVVLVAVTGYFGFIRNKKK